MHTLPSLVIHGLTTGFHTSSSLEEGTKGIFITYSQVVGRENKICSFLLKKQDFCGCLLKTEMASFARQLNRLATPKPMAKS
jgi:hypothetical protein